MTDREEWEAAWLFLLRQPQGWQGDWEGTGGRGCRRERGGTLLPHGGSFFFDSCMQPGHAHVCACVTHEVGQGCCCLPELGGGRLESFGNFLFCTVVGCVLFLGVKPPSVQTLRVGRGCLAVPMCRVWSRERVGRSTWESGTMAHTVVMGVLFHISTQAGLTLRRGAERASWRGRMEKVRTSARASNQLLAPLNWRFQCFPPGRRSLCSATGVTGKSNYGSGALSPSPIRDATLLFQMTAQMHL